MLRPLGYWICRQRRRRPRREKDPGYEAVAIDTIVCQMIGSPRKVVEKTLLDILSIAKRVSFKPVAFREIPGRQTAYIVLARTQHPELDAETCADNRDCKDASDALARRHDRVLRGE
mmetsp:Transcript_5371/g.22152  ORF Transcript_5371/g.22152 Transcript_5371/m.22152 type:complete len:117 (-) Transcript_5371:1005-1355(-)